MRRFLSIIIPHYKENEKEMFPLLSSIQNQVGVDLKHDVEVIISTDGGGTPVDLDFLSLFWNLNVKLVILDENKGPGVTRQHGLDHAIGQYVMFCDADDCLHNVGVLHALFNELDKLAPDFLTSSWIEEIIQNETATYLLHEIDNTWMFGKVFRREFLVQNNIRFHDELRVHEDSYFLSIVSDLVEKKYHLPATTYVWRMNFNSITRINDGVYRYSQMPEFIRACMLASEQVEKLAPQKMQWKIVQFILYNYFSYHMPDWQEQDEFRCKAEEAFVKYIKPYWHYWSNSDQGYINNVYNEERQRTFRGCIENETVWDWIKRLGL